MGVTHRVETALATGGVRRLGGPLESDDASAGRAPDAEEGRTRSTQPAPADEVVARSLRRRLLVVEDDGGWRLRVPLMERWLRQRG